MKIDLKQAADVITKCKNFVITSHVNPDGDALGSVLGLAHYLKAIGKNVTCLIDDDLPANFNILPGYELLSKPGQIIEKIDLLIVLDTGIDRIGQIKELTNAPILNIDHHISNNSTVDYLYVDPDRAATGEIIFQLLKLMKAVFDKNIATCLYTAIATDCGFFRYANTTALTMRIGAELLDFDVKPNLISEAIEKKPLATVRGIALALNTLEIFKTGEIALLAITQDILNQCKSTEGFIDLARIIEGVDVAVMVKYVDENTCRISMRSKATNVSLIAETFGGGGHIRAAGCTIQTSVESAKQTIVAAIEQSMEDQHNA